MESLQSTATRALRSMLDRQPTTAAKVAFAWQIAAGPALGRAAICRWSDDGVVRVQAATAAWDVELRRAQRLLAGRLRGLLGPGVMQEFIIEPPAGGAFRAPRAGHHSR